MSEKVSLRRFVVCIDGVTETSPSTNPSSIDRIRNCVKTGQFADDTGRTITQDVFYYQALLPGGSFAGRFGKSVSPSEQQIQDIALDILKRLDSASDEIFIFASSHGAFTARALAGILHHMGVPRADFVEEFPVLYKNALNLIKARREDDSLNGGKALTFLRAKTDGSPNIVFMGLLDALKSSADKQIHDTSIVPSIRHFRHAMAFNETRSANALDQPETPSAKEMAERSFVQAWFLGHHPDMIGSTQHDGLSLYPLQWLLIEAILRGLIVSVDITGKERQPAENPLALVFPQYTGGPPDLSGTEKIQWQIQYTNNITVNMFDLQSVHVSKASADDRSHTIHFETMNPFYNVPRRAFSKEGLVGFVKGQEYGTIIHPSVFCILDRNQRLYEQSRFKALKESLADFEVNCMRGGTMEMAPWLEDSQLLASGVKAFRILVCGKTGVGKSTLINKVFGIEMTEESNTYAQGNHDINVAFESPNHPGLLIHDSRGWQAGSDHELDLIAQFLRYRAFQKDPADALHVIWFCVDSDVSRIEEADKRTFETISKYSNHVPVFVVGTKKDKLVAFRKLQLLEQYMGKLNDYQEANRLANAEADRLAQEQFIGLKDQLSQIKSYKADGYVCLSKNDDAGVKNLLSQTLDMIVDERVRLFCVAAQVVDVEQKIDSAITECMRLGKHAIRTAMVPLPLSGIVGTPTVSRIICEHVLQCFGFPKAMPDEVDAIMSSIVLGNLKQFMTVSLTQLLTIGAASIGIAVGTVGVGALFGLVSSFLSTPPTARMLLKCACDMILILERSFRYSGKYVSTKQIEDAAKQYVTIHTTTFAGKEKRLQDHVHDEVDKMIPLKNVAIGFRFSKLRSDFEQIIYKNRFDRPPQYEERDPLEKRIAELEGATTTAPAELSTESSQRAELPGTSCVVELDGTSTAAPSPMPDLPVSATTSPTLGSVQSPLGKLDTAPSPSVTTTTWSTALTELSASPPVSSKDGLQRGKSEGSSFFSRSLKSMKIKKWKSAK